MIRNPKEARIACDGDTSQDDILVLRRAEIDDTERTRLVRIPIDNYRTLNYLANETNLSMCKVAGKLLDYAIERTVVEK